MAIEYLKRGKPEAARAEDDAKVATIVEATLKDIEARGDIAVRELANKFDGYDRDTYRLSSTEIEKIILNRRQLVVPLARRMKPRQPHRGIELIHRAVGRHPHRMLGHPRPVPQSGFARIACLRVDFASHLLLFELRHQCLSIHRILVDLVDLY